MTKAIENDRECLVRVLLVHEIKPGRLDIWAALDVLEKTKDSKIPKRLLDEAGGTDQLLTENATLILG